MHTYIYTYIHTYIHVHNINTYINNVYICIVLMPKNMSTGYDIPESQAMLLLLIIDLKCEKPFFTLKQLSLSLGEN